MACLFRWASADTPAGHDGAHEGERDRGRERPVVALLESWIGLVGHCPSPPDLAEGKDSRPPYALAMNVPRFLGVR